MLDGETVDVVDPGRPLQDPAQAFGFLNNSSWRQMFACWNVMKRNEVAEW